MPRPPQGFDIRLVISVSNLLALVALLVTAIGTWTTLQTGIAETKIVVAGMEKKIERLDITASNAARDLGLWQIDVTKQLAELRGELKRFSDNQGTMPIRRP